MQGISYFSVQAGPAVTARKILAPGRSTSHVEQIKLRNHSCPYYQKCLDRAVKQGLQDFDCAGCVHVGEKTQISLDEFWRCCLLFARAYRPDVYREYDGTMQRD